MARVIKADHREPFVQKAVVTDARQVARELIEAAERSADAVRAQAEREGHAVAQARLAAELVQLAAARDRMLGELQAQGVELALQAAQRIVGQELALRPELAREQVVALLARLRRARSVTVRLHPDDHATLGPELAALRTRAQLAGTLALEADAGIARGGCVVQSDIGTLDARVETQLAALQQALRTARERGER